MGRQQQLHDAESCFGSHRREHGGIFQYLIRILLSGCARRYISVFAEIAIRPSSDLLGEPQCCNDAPPTQGPGPQTTPADRSPALFLQVSRILGVTS
jgi:hypothetical protein